MCYFVFQARGVIKVIKCLAGDPRRHIRAAELFKAKEWRNVGPNALSVGGATNNGKCVIKCLAGDLRRHVRAAELFERRVAERRPERVKRGAGRQTTENALLSAWREIPAGMFALRSCLKRRSGGTSARRVKRGAGRQTTETEVI